MRSRRGEINLYVTDLERAARFYCDALEFTLCESEDTYRKVQQGDFTITFFLAKEKSLGEPLGQRPGMTADILVDDLDEAIARIRACGGTVAPVRTYDGGRFTLFRDPDGIDWELIRPDGE